MRKTDSGDKRVRVNLVTRDTALQRHLSWQEKRQDLLSFRFSYFPLSAYLNDIYVVPIEWAEIILKRKLHLLPVIAYGSGISLPRAFQIGCGDYLKTPLDLKELFYRVARIEKMNRFHLACGNLSVKNRFLIGPAHSFSLTGKEEKILTLLLVHHDSYVPREALDIVVWEGKKPLTRSLDVHISHIRRKIRGVLPQTCQGELLKNSRNEGYRLSSCNLCT